MRAAEIMLGIAAGIGGWIILFAHALVLAAIPRTDCGGDSASLWVGTAILGILGALGVLAAGLGLRWRASLRWVALFVLPLALYDLSWIAPALASTTLGELSLCALTAKPELAVAPPSRIERVWPALQVAVLIGALFQALRFWRPAEEASGT